MSAVLFGAWVRLLIPWMAGFPVNDGGLFYVMLRTLLANGLKMPAYVQWNGMDIPFAYPPLGFYVGALSALVFRVDAIKVLQWLPAIALVAALPAFYLVAKSLLGTAFRAGIATLVFAFTPRAITWQVMGGGLTRALGQLFLILAVAFIYRTFTKYTRRDLVFAVLCSALVVLSHPEAALQTVGLAIILWLFAGRNKAALLHALEIGAGTLVLTSVWWLPAIVRYGAGTLLSAAQTGQFNALFLFEPFLMNFVDEPLMSIIAVLGVIGVAHELSRRHALLTALLFTPFLVEPRSAPTVAMVPLALLAALALTEIILPGLAGLSQAQLAGANLMRCRPVVLFLVFMAVYMLGNASYFGTQLAGTVLSPATREAFAWVKANTPPGSRFLVLTGNTESELFCDAPLEWFPALTDRISLTTVQGSEWLPGDRFARVASASRAVANCTDSEQPLSCLNGALPSYPEAAAFDYIYLARRAPVLSSCRTVGQDARGQLLIDELKASPKLSVVYDADGVLVFGNR